MTFDFDVIEKELDLDGDLQSIRFQLPELYFHQHEDVQRAEKRFANGGKGYLFTNGTGTGKTYVGLGVAKRFYLRGQVNILIVVPTEQKCSDWCRDGANLGMSVHMLVDVEDAGFEVSVTTYANFYQNNAINRRHWDLIIYDESHYLEQNEQGKTTVYFEKHRDIAKLPSVAKRQADALVPKLAPGALQEHRENRKQMIREVAQDITAKTKVLFLSATPFAYHKSVGYADGCLWDIYETLDDDDDYVSKDYNEATGFSKFMVEHFGYRMRYDKCTHPESGVDVNLLERSFFEKHVEKGVMSTRILELEQDYSREFITLDSEIGQIIEAGINLFHDTDFIKEFPMLTQFKKGHFSNIFLNQILEVIKAQKVHTRIQQHLDLGRKVVVFHAYNNLKVSHVFQFNAYAMLPDDKKYYAGRLQEEIDKFERKYPQYWNLSLSELKNTREAICDRFKSARQFNGTVNKKLRKQYVDAFNSDLSGVNILVVQTKAGREGISLHDTTGIYQRVIIAINLPTAPTEAIQTEGRVYREGLVSNAIYEYMTIQTNFERFAFAEKIAERAKTAENLAMGNLARDLETAFKEGYMNSNDDPPSLSQGVGGKQADRFLYSISDFEKSKTFYWARGKKTSRNKSREGTDYFATPEPLGFKMVQWLDPQPGNDMLEPSAGHGAIARWFPESTTNHFIEQSSTLAAELAVSVSGKVHVESFEQHYIGNKYNHIAMNPPFGTAGKMAMEHVRKACGHLQWYGTVLAIVPNGPAMEKRIEEFLSDKAFSYMKFTGEIILPSVTFERAGTSVSCRIIRLEKTNLDYEFRRIDLSYCKTINNFFDAIENITF